MTSRLTIVLVIVHVVGSFALNWEYPARRTFHEELTRYQDSGAYKDSCIVAGYNRRECGWGGITKERCEKRNCCFDDRTRGVKWCFKPIPDKCDVAGHARQECGWGGISKETCESKNCCFDNTIRGVKWCFKPKPGVGDTCACPVKKFDHNWKIDKIDYLISEGDIAAAAPKILKTQTATNPAGAADMQYVFEYTQTLTEEYSYNTEAGISVTAGASFSAGIPGIGEAGGYVETTASFTQSWGETKSTSYEIKESVTVFIPGGKTYKAVATIKEGSIKVPYVMTLKRTNYDDSKVCKCQVSGEWEGVSFYDSRFVATDITNTKRELTDLEIEQASNDASSCDLTDSGWRCTKNGLIFVEYHSYPFPESSVGQLSRMSGRNTESCNKECSNNPDCAGYVRRNSVEMNQDGECLMVTASVLKNACAGTGAATNYQVFAQHGRENNCKII